MNNEDAVITKEHLTQSFNKPKEVKPKHRGRLPGFEHLKPMDIESTIIRLECTSMMLEYPWIRELKLVSNPYMYRTYGRANYKTNTIEISEKASNEPKPVQREVFVRTVSHFIAKRLFDEAGDGPGYQVVLARFLRKQKGQSNSTGVVASLAETTH